VPNFWKALSINPDHLEATWQKLKAVMKPGKLDLLTKEIIALAVSITKQLRVLNPLPQRRREAGSGWTTRPSARSWPWWTSSAAPTASPTPTRSNRT